MVTVLSFVLLILSCCHLDVVFSYVLEPDVELFNEVNALKRREGSDFEIRISTMVKNVNTNWQA